MADSQERFGVMLYKLREQRYRITPQRIAVLKILSESKGHPSVENIYKQVKKDFPTTSLATVYKTLTLLKELGEVLELGFPEGSNRYDGNRPNPHPHVICIKCKKIVDPDLDSLDEMKKEVELDTNFKILNHRLDFFGICSNCMAKKV